MVRVVRISCGIILLLAACHSWTIRTDVMTTGIALITGFLGLFLLGLGLGVFKDSTK